MHITAINLTDYGPFRGDHFITLRNTAYSLTARRDGEPERSNWQGKSTLLGAVRHALYGEHVWATEDDWIHLRASRGAVGVTIDDGAGFLVINRIRARGRATKLTVEHNGRKAEGPKAEELIAQVVGLASGDFDATCWFGQKRMDRFIVASPAERMEVARGWLHLGRLEDCAGNCTSHLHAATSRLQGALARIENARANRTSWLAEAGVARADLQNPDNPTEATKVLEERAATLQQGLEETEGQLASLEDEKTRWHERQVAAEKRVNFDKLVERGKVMKAQLLELEARALDSAVASANAEYQEVAGETRDARRELNTCVELAAGEFDGKCPVMGKSCPAADVVRSDVDAHAKRARKAQEKLSEFGAEEEAVKSKLTQLRGDLTRRDLYREQLTDMREQARALRQYEKAEPPEPLEDIATRTSQLRQEVADIKAKQMAIHRARQKLDQLAKEEAEASRERDEAQLAADAWRASVAVFRRAQRVIAERALAEMRTGANRALTECGVDLSLEVSWAREGKGLADTCDSCGAPMPASARAKCCPKCGEARGPKMIPRLDLMPSSTSGGAHDLAGVAFQLAASAWLRRDRGTAWGSALIDEPFGALDPPNRRALANHLAAMLPRYGFGQSIVVSHSAETTHALPGRITVIGSPDGSRVEVSTP